MVAAPAGPDLIHAEAHMNKKHEHHGDPVIKLGEYRGKSVEIISQFSLPIIVCRSGHLDTRPAPKFAVKSSPLDLRSR